MKSKSSQDVQEGFSHKIVLLSLLLAAEILGIHVKGRLTLSGEELEGMDSLQLGDAIQQVKRQGYTILWGTPL